jgi:hypothetical protein
MTCGLGSAGGPSLVVPGSRWASLARAAYGAVLIIVPGRLISARTGRAASRRACLVARVLGARHLIQALVCGTMPTRWLIRAGTAADLLHAGSMVALAAEDSGLRPALLTDAGIAAGFAVAGGAYSRAGGPVSS